MKLGMTILVLFILALLVTDIQGHGSREMDDETHDVIVKALRGEFCIPVKERTTRCPCSSLEEYALVWAIGRRQDNDIRWEIGGKKDKL